MIITLSIIGYLVVGLLVSSIVVYYDQSFYVDDDIKWIFAMLFVWPIVVLLMGFEKYFTWISDLKRKRDLKKKINSTVE